MNLQDVTLTWQKEPARAEALVVHSQYYRREQLAKQDEVYRNQTWLDPEGLAQGNASLRGVRTQDEGVYLCHITSELGWTSEHWELRVGGECWGCCILGWAWLMQCGSVSPSSGSSLLGTLLVSSLSEFPPRPLSTRLPKNSVPCHTSSLRCFYLAHSNATLS
ncbi:V-set domain-containing T-cell activation inhibitor 1 [Platysternon megacephalum]|uniref:V-set domain-containing T-cell activation inhibitor 1 n=1 Tax=Platysternon megacephalum TaxID=55544 RepID=A0A4D9EV80_9SAUR|nr:V-set domain-containing T-cell activation inhibitor 1 [Platysternon megacephalum]